MRRIAAIGLNTFREAVRDRVLYAVLGLASMVLIFTLALAELSLDQQERVVRDVGLASISLFGVLVAIFLGSSLLFKEIERKTLYVILPKPIHRWEFLVGKFFGIALTGAVFVVVMGSVQLLVMGVQAGGSLAELGGGLLLLIASVVLGGWRARERTLIWVPWSLLALTVSGVFAVRSGIDVSPIAAALVLYIGELAILTAVALFFSSFSTPFTTGGLTFGVWLVGRSADSLETMRSQLLSEELKGLLRGVAKVVPNFNLFVPGRHTETEPWAYVGTAMGYGTVYVLILLILAAAIFRRRDFI